MATLAITRDHSPVFSSDSNIWASATMRTRHPSESRICLTALPPGALSSRTRMPTCGVVEVGLGLVLTILSIAPVLLLNAASQAGATYRARVAYPLPKPCSERAIGRLHSRCRL